MLNEYKLQSDRLQAAQNEMNADNFARKAAEKKRKQQLMIAYSFLLLGAVTTCGFLEYLGGVLKLPR